MWSDPDVDTEGFKISSRGAGYLFGKDVVDRFLHANDCTKVYRAHQLCMEGYHELFDGKLVTVWSAPNYCYRYENLASILELDERLNCYFNIFEDAPENERKKTEAKKKGVGVKMRQVEAIDNDFFI
jgi:serine/threonine-protein phosphatase PPG1